MEEPHRRGRDEMNIAVLPISRLGRSDKRTSLEYYGTFAENGKQKDMVWVVDGGKMGLPTEFAERVLIALLHIGSQQNFQSRKMTFSSYEVLKIVGHTNSGRNYLEVKEAIRRLVALTIYSDQAWFDHAKKKRITSSHVFHLIEEASFHQEEGSDTEESSIVWGSRFWNSIQAGYLKYLDLDFYYSLDLPLTRRLFRFLDKMMAYQEQYQIDLYALQNKLGMAPYEYPSHLKRPIAKAAKELVKRGWLSDFEFVKVGKFHRIVFYKAPAGNYQLSLFEDEPEEKTVIVPSLVEPDPWLDVLAQVQKRDPNAYKQLQGTKLVSTSDGMITVSAGRRAERAQMIMGKNRTLRRMTLWTLTELLGEEITGIRFVD